MVKHRAPASAVGVGVTFMGRSSALPIILHRRKVITFFRNVIQSAGRISQNRTNRTIKACFRTKHAPTEIRKTTKTTLQHLHYNQQWRQQ